MPASADEAIKALLAQTRAYLADQGDLHLQGLQVDPTLLRRRAMGKAPTVPAPPAGVEAVTEPLIGEVVPDSSLSAVRAHLGQCTRCTLSGSRTSIVFGVGNPQADLMLVGEAPGRDEDLQGEPFVGEAGRLLDRMLGAMGLDRGKVYIANIIKCRPPKNRFPAPDEVAACHPFVLAQLRAIKPKVVVAMGRLAAHTLLDTSSPISKMRGQWQEQHGVTIMPTFHPAYLLRNPKDKGLVWQDLQAVMAFLHLPMPQKGR
jgi:uracil-DNA glycosylase family 4